jgi:class I fructose-bisphosphate aldolase
MILPVDHGLTYGRIAGLERVDEVLSDAVAAGCDGLLMSLATARLADLSWLGRGGPARLLTIDSWFGITDTSAGSAALTSSVEQAVRYGFDAVKLLMPWDTDSDDQAATAGRIAGVVEKAEPWGMPVLVEPIALSMERGKEAISLEIDAARIAVELGADVVKMAYPGDPDLLARTCDELRVPVLILGGPKIATVDELLQMVDDAMSAGAAGIAIGRGVWQRSSDLRRALVGALTAVVHREMTADQAAETVRVR